MTIENFSILAGIGILVALAGLFLKRSPKNNNPAHIGGVVHSEEFQSLKDNPKIPVLDKCKSLNKTLKNILKNAAVNIFFISLYDMIIH